MAAKARYLMSLGLASRAGKLVSGEQMTETAVRSGQARLVILASDASENTRRHFENQCHYYGVPIVYAESREVLGQAIGKVFRASAAVTDDNFASLITRQMKNER